jgi:mannose-1-phosphate guanylyltransferase/mannose-6-phosphate isomerase
MCPISITPVILSGGSGSRLWPLSRAGYPKQFLPLVGDETMMQQTALRAMGDKFDAPMVICNEDHRFLVAEQLRACACDPADILLEPVGRNTAPAVAVAALRLLEDKKDGLMLVMPSDHVIANQDAFMSAIESAATAAAQGMLVTFGINPTGPETGYGYIQADSELSDFPGVHQVKRFVEKPDQVTAATYLEEGGYAWNSGIFLFSARAYLDELKKTQPKMIEACSLALEESERDLNFCRLNAHAFAQSPSDSIDYAVMEKTDRAAVVPVDMGWNDLGAWSSLWEIADKDAFGNATHGDVLLHETNNSLVRAEHGLAAVVGLDDVVVITTDDAVLVSHRDKVQQVKNLVDTLKAEGRTEHVLHTRVHRPWGSYSSMDNGERYQVKRIEVKPGEQLSLQMHYHRAEHWIVVQGTARVTRGEETFLLGENQSTYIPAGETHRLENPGKVPLHLIEVQSGSYMGEDDIVRFEDNYGR